MNVIYKSGLAKNYPSIKQEVVDDMLKAFNSDCEFVQVVTGTGTVILSKTNICSIYYEEEKREIE